MASHGYSVGYSTTKQLELLRDKLGRFTKQVNTRPKEIMLEESTRMYQEACMQVPEASGDLYDSIQAGVASSSKTRVTMHISASSFHNGYDYAGIQHDNTAYNHPNGGKPFYLRDPFNDAVNRIEQRLEAEIKYD